MATKGLQTFVNKVNKRYKSLDTRKIKFGASLQKKGFEKILRQNNLATKNGKLSATKLEALGEARFNNVMNQLQSFVENTTAKALQSNLQSNKRALTDTFKDKYGIDVSKLSDEQYEQFWKKIHELENEFSDGDYDANNVTIVSELTTDLLNDVIDEDTIDEFFEVIKDVEPGNGVDFLRDLQSNGYNFDQM